MHHAGDAYEGRRHREHADDDPVEVRAARLLKSIDNTFSFRFTRPALVRALLAAGFTSVLEAHAPLESGRAPDRVTLVDLTAWIAELYAEPGLTTMGHNQRSADLARRPRRPARARGRARARARDGVTGSVVRPQV